MSDLYSAAVFEVEREVFTWRDVLLLAHRAGRWDAVVDELAEGLRAVALAETIEDESLDEAVDEAAAEFRYDRELITADETEAWLRERGITPAAWMASIRRAVCRARFADRVEELAGLPMPSHAAIEAELLVELRCSSLGREHAEWAAGAAAAAAAADAMEPRPGAPLTGALPPGLEPTHARQRLPLIDGILAGVDRFREQVISADALVREIRLHQLEWVQLDCQTLTFEGADSAREAVMCLRDDGLSIEEVASDAHLEPVAIRFFVEDLEPELQTRFVSAMPGDVIGPSPREGQHMLYLVLSKMMPGDQDPAVRARAADRLVARAIAAEAQRRVRWRTHL